MELEQRGGEEHEFWDWAVHIALNSWSTMINIVNAEQIIRPDPYNEVKMNK